MRRNFPESQALFARLLTEAGFRNENGTYDKARYDKVRFCKESGISYGMYDHFLAGTAKLSIEKIVEIEKALNFKFL